MLLYTDLNGQNIRYTTTNPHQLSYNTVNTHHLTPISTHQHRQINQINHPNVTYINPSIHTSNPNPPFLQ